MQNVIRTRRFSSSSWINRASDIYKGRIRYQETYKDSITKSEEFWSKEASALKWTKSYEKILDADSSFPASLWFPGGKINICENALDENIKNGRGEQTAIIFKSYYNGIEKILTYNQLLEQVSKFAG